MKTIKEWLLTGAMIILVIGCMVCNYGVVHGEQVNIVQERPDITILFTVIQEIMLTFRL